MLKYYFIYLHRKKLRKNMYYTEDRNSRLGLTEFTEVMFDNLSMVISNKEHVEQNYSFYEHAFFKFFDKYYNSKTEQYSINQILTIFEITLSSMFLYQPSTELPEDLINIV